MAYIICISPFLCAQLGIFGKDIDIEISKAFLKNIPSRFKYWDIYLNHQNILHLKDFNISLRNNFILKLSPSYDELYKNYRKIYKETLKRLSSLVASRKQIFL